MSQESQQIPPELQLELQDAIDLPTQEVLLAASEHDIPRLRALLRTDEQLVNAQDGETGQSALHAAITACEAESEEVRKSNAGSESQPGQRGDQHNGVALTVNGGSNSGEAGKVATSTTVPPQPEVASTIEKAKATVQWLLQNGAIWNQLDANDETPGCVALRLGLLDIYKVMVDAGTRAELLLSRLGEYEELAGTDDENEDDEGGTNELGVAAADAQNGVVIGEEAAASIDAAVGEDTAASNDAFLRSELTFQPNVLIDRDANGVMMEWERDIMQKTADLLLPTEGLRVLNIGHGMGIIDDILQTKKPSSHHIIEAHPTVCERLKAQGWPDRPGVQVHQGRWQDIVPKLVEEGVQFDAVFYDTFAEDYSAFKTLFEDHMIGLLDDSGRWSFFNGLGADRQISYDVYKNIVSMELQEAGYEVAWTTLEVPDLVAQGVWEGTKRPYWTLKQYSLPICSFFT